MTYTITDNKVKAPIEPRNTDGRYDQRLAMALVADSYVPTMNYNGETKYCYFKKVQGSGSPMAEFECNPTKHNHEAICAQVNLAQELFSAKMDKLMALEREMSIIAAARRENP